MKNQQQTKSHYLLVEFSFYGLFLIGSPSLSCKSLSLKSCRDSHSHIKVQCTRGTQNNFYQLNLDIYEKISHLQNSLNHSLIHMCMYVTPAMWQALCGTIMWRRLVSSLRAYYQVEDKRPDTNNQSSRSNVVNTIRMI